MKKLLSILLPAVLACNKEPKVCGCTDLKAANFNKEANCSDTSCKYQGDATFWIYDYNWGSKSVVRVTVNGVTKEITRSIPKQVAPFYCNVTGCASFRLPVGTYNYTAHLDNDPSGNPILDKDFSGTFTIIKNSCTLIAFER